MEFPSSRDPHFTIAPVGDVARHLRISVEGVIYKDVGVHFLPRIIFPLFDPHHVHIAGIVSPTTPDGIITYLELDRAAQWLNLRSIAFVNSSPQTCLLQSHFARVEGRRQFKVIFDFARRWPVPSPPLKHQQDVVQSNMDELLGGLQGQPKKERRSILASKVVEEVVIRVRVEEQKEYLLEWMRKAWEEEDFGLEEQRKREGKIRWEVVGWRES